MFDLLLDGWQVGITKQFFRKTFNLTLSVLIGIGFVVVGTIRELFEMFEGPIDE
jgi:hypothetical protein